MSSEAGLSLKLPREPFLAALGAVLGAVASKATIPVLTHLILSAEGGEATVTGTNLDAQMTARIPADVEMPGRVTVAAQALHDIARKMRDGSEIAIKADPAKMTTTVSSGRSRFTLPGFPPDDFPDFNGAARHGSGADAFGQPIRIAGGTLANALKRCQFAISTEETRHYLGGIYCHCQIIDGAPLLRMVATTGHVLARIDTTRATGLDPAMPGVILPRKAVDLARKLAEGAGDAIVELEVSTRLMRVTAGAITFVSKLIDGTFPDYVRVIPTSFQRECIAPTLAMIAAVDRVSSVAIEKSRAVKLSFTADTIAITLRDNSGGQAHDEVDAELTGDPLEIGFNAKYLAETLGQAGGDTIRISLGADAVQPAVLTDRLGEALFILMPMRV